MEMMIAVSIALVLAIVAIVLAAMGRSTSRKYHEEIKKQLGDCSTQIEENLIQVSKINREGARKNGRWIITKTE